MIALWQKLRAYLNPYETLLEVENENLRARIFSFRCGKHDMVSHPVKSIYCCECGEPFAKVKK